MQTAKTRPALIETADKIIAMLPEDAANTIEGWIKAKNAAAAPAEEPPDEATAPRPRRLRPPHRRSPSTSSADKQKLDTLINKGVPMPSPAAPAVVPTPRKT